MDTSSKDTLSAEQSTPIFTPSQYAEILKLLGQTTLTSPDANVANMAGIHSAPCNDQWILDTGATEHMTGDICLLHNAKSVSGPSSSVRLPSGDHVPTSSI